MIFSSKKGAKKLYRSNASPSSFAGFSLVITLMSRSPMRRRIIIRLLSLMMVCGGISKNWRGSCNPFNLVVGAGDRKGSGRPFEEQSGFKVNENLF